MRKPRPRSSAPCGQKRRLGSLLELLNFLPPTPPPQPTTCQQANSFDWDVWATRVSRGAPLRAHTELLPSVWSHRFGTWRVSSQRQEGAHEVSSRGEPPRPAQPLLLPWLVSGLAEGIHLEVSKCTVCILRGSRPPKGQPHPRSVPSTHHHHPPRVQLEPGAPGF